MYDHWKHELLLRTIKGDTGDVYANTTLAGKRGGNLKLLSYFARYDDGNFPYVELAHEAPGLRVAASTLLKAKYPAENAKTVGRRTNVVLSSNRAGNQLLLELCVVATAPRGLPMFFAVFLQRMPTEEELLVLYYPKVVEGRWALAQFKQMIQRRRPE